MFWVVEVESGGVFSETKAGAGGKVDDEGGIGVVSVQCDTCNFSDVAEG